MKKLAVVIIIVIASLAFAPGVISCSNSHQKTELLHEGILENIERFPGGWGSTSTTKITFADGWVYMPNGNNTWRIYTMSINGEFPTEGIFLGNQYRLIKIYESGDMSSYCLQELWER